MDDNVIEFPKSKTSATVQKVPEEIAIAIARADSIDRELKSKRTARKFQTAGSQRNSASRAKSYAQNDAEPDNSCSQMPASLNLRSIAGRFIGIGFLMTAYVLFLVDWPGMNTIIPNFNLVSSSVLAGVTVAGIAVNAKHLFDA